MTSLILVPTRLEAVKLEPLLEISSDAAFGSDHPWRLELCGFGPIAAAASTASLIVQVRPRQVVLVGLAGTFCPETLPLGTAVSFAEVICHGVGVGSGRQFQSAGDLGWSQLEGTNGGKLIGDRIELDLANTSDGDFEHPRGAALLSCCAASADETDAAERRSRYPRAVAEDMEGFAVAMSCVRAGVSCRIIRGICNRVGDRDHEKWKIDEAITSAASLTRKLL